MGRTRMLSTAVLLALLVAVLLSLPGEGGQAVAVEPRAVTTKVMIPAAAFAPGANHYRYTNGGEMVITPDHAVMVAPVLFPVPEVTIQGITLYAKDQGPSQSVCAYLVRAIPAQGQPGSKYQGQACTADSSADPQAVSNLRRISPNTVNTRTQGSYLLVDITGQAFFYGVRVSYTYETTP